MNATDKNLKIKSCLHKKGKTLSNITLLDQVIYLSLKSQLKERVCSLKYAMSSFPRGTKIKKLTAIMTDNTANTLVAFSTKLPVLLKLKRSVFNSKYSKYFINVILVLL